MPFLRQKYFAEKMEAIWTNNVTTTTSFICMTIQTHTVLQKLILGEPGADSRAGLKGATKVFKHGRKNL